MNYAIVLAGGSGLRAGGLLPKQFQPLKGSPVVIWSIRTFHRFDPGCRIVVVVHRDYMDFWYREIQPVCDREGIRVEIAEGGNSRIHSVRNGLLKIREMIGKHTDSPSANPIVLIHDGARPFLTTRMIDEGVKYVAEGIGAIPVLPVTDSLRIKRGEETDTVDRSLYLAVQTPQIFRYEDIYRAYLNAGDEVGLTDDASVAEQSGIKIATYSGAPINIKITNPVDFAIGEALATTLKASTTE